MNPREPGSSKDNPDLDWVRAEFERNPSPEPPALLDQAVINTARRAVEPETGRRPWSFGWVHGLSTFGIIVIAVGLMQPWHSSNSPLGENASPAIERTQRFGDEAYLQAEEAGDAFSDGASKKEAPGKLRNLSNRTMAEDAPMPAASAVPPGGEENTSWESSRELMVRDAPAAPGKPESAQLESVAEDEPMSPAAWLQVIQNLFQEGEAEEARLQLEAFLSAYPDYPLPEDLDP